MIKLRNLNNACTLVKSGSVKMLLDPWLFGDLYNGAWALSDTYTRQNPSIINNLTHIFISHIHQDHWDIDTLKKINKNATVLIPEYGFNNVIKNSVSNLGFDNISMIKVGQWININHLKIYIIPPLNAMAQDIEWYENKSKETPIAIDTGIVINDGTSQTYHIILNDNTPYDLMQLKQHLPKQSIDSFWFPYNGFAQDYPLCYDSLSTDEKNQISLEMSIKRESSLLKAIHLIQPKYLIPHSSDFVLNGPRKNEFLLVHSGEFLDKKKYAKRIEKITNIPAYALFAKDYIQFVKNSEVDIFIDKKTQVPSIATDKLALPQSQAANSSTLELLNIALKNMVERCNRLNIAIKNFTDWQLKIKLTEGEIYILDFENQTVLTSENTGKKILTLEMTSNICRCILNKNLHINNCQIACYLTWKREPNEFNKWLYDALNFLHL